jgi:DnaK suppressor protein
MPTKKATKTVADETTGNKTMPKKTATEKAAAETRHSALDGFRTYTPYDEKPGEEYMNAKQTEHFREILLAWRRELMEEVDRTVHHMQDEAANFPDPNDRATQESEFSMELRTRDRERKLLKKIDEGLEALDNGEYGFCESCGVEIGIRRLEARPTATLCIDCKTLDEIREKQRG